MPARKGEIQMVVESTAGLSRNAHASLGKACVRPSESGLVQADDFVQPVV